MYQKFLIALLGLVVFGAALTIAQVWGPVISWDIYTKLIITTGILVLLIGFVLVIKSDLGQHKKLKDENYLD